MAEKDSPTFEDKLSDRVQNELIQQTITSIIREHFPVTGKHHTLELVGDIKVNDNLKDWDFPAQREIKLNARSWTIPVTGTFKLIDNVTGKIIDTVKDVRIANIPKMTNRFSMIIDGNEYTTLNQFRLSPGVYTRQKNNGEMESQFNLAVGFNFLMTMDPANGIFYLDIRKQSFHLYSLLKALGVSDEEMHRNWGDKLYEANRVAGAGEETKEIPLMWEKLRKQKLPYEEALRAIKDYLDRTKMSIEATQITLGQGFGKVTPQALLSASSKLLKVMRGELPEDERDSLIFKNLLTIDDQLKGYFEKRIPAIKRNLLARTDNRNSIHEIISSDTFTKPVRDFFTTHDLSNPSPQTNPVEMISEWRKTTLMGTGGIQSEHAITMKTRDVHPTHLGFLDPLNTPESEKAGVTLPLAVDVVKHGDTIKTKIVTPDGKEKLVTPAEFYQMKIGFPDQHTDGKAKNDLVKAVYRGISTVLKKEDIDGYLYRPFSMFAWTTNLVPFLGYNSGNRALVAAKMMTQSVPIENPESPLVKVLTTQDRSMDDVLGNYLNPKVPPALFPNGAIVEKVDDNYIHLISPDGKIKEKIGLFKDFPLNQESFLDSHPVVEPGMKVKPLEQLAHTNFNDKYGDYAPGLNANVAYMPWYGYNFEDGIVVTDSFAKRATSVIMQKKSLQVDPNGILSKEKFRAYFPMVLTEENVGKLDDDGIIKEGSIIKPSEILVAYLHPADLTDYERVLKQMNRLVSNPYRDRSLVWDDLNEGTVTHVRHLGRTINVYVKVRQPLVVGDKLAGRYGDKGIVTKIIRDSEAPYTKDGTRIDIIVNPHGVVGRMNMGQLLETAAGKIAKKTGKPYLVRNFSDKDYLADIVSEMKKYNITPDEILYNGKDGKPFDTPIFWGVKHYLKLMHVVEHKYKARGLPGSYTMEEQPSEGEHGGQSMDPLQMYSYLAWGAKSNLYEFAAVKGQKNDEYWRALQLGFPPPPPQKNFVFDKMLAYMQAAGVNIKKDGYTIKVYPATSKDVLSWSNGAIKDATFLRGKDLIALEGGLFDPKITGGLRGTQWSHIKLNHEIPNPLYEKAVTTLLGITGTMFDKIMSESYEEDGKTGTELIKYRLKKIDVDEELENSKRALKEAKPSQINTLNTKIRYLEALQKTGLTPIDAYMMSVVPVLPPIFRPVYPLPSGDLQVSPINKHYRDISLINNKINEIRKIGLDDKEFNRQNRIDLYETVKAEVGLSEPITYTKEKYEGLLGTLAGSNPKQGFVQNKVWSRAQDLSARSTITVEPSLGVDEVGLPDIMSKQIFKPFIIRELVRQGFRPLQAIDEFKRWTPLADQALNNVMKNRPVLLNRAPSLHKHSVQAFKPIRFDGQSIRINPLIVKGFNADFDGDAMSVHVPVSDEAVEEAYRMLPSKNLYKAGDKVHMINIEQDYQLGLYFLTLPGKLTGKSFKTSEAAEKAGLGMQDVFTLNGKQVTLGKIYVNELLPEELRDYDKVFDSKTVKKLLERLDRDYPLKFADVIDGFKELGRRYAVQRGTTLSIIDMALDRSFRDSILKKYEKQIKPGMNKFQVASIYMQAKKEVADKQDELATKTHNRFYDMLRSGSSGRKEQITQILSMPGILEDIHGEPIPYPNKKSWSEGLDTFDYWNSTYGARKGVVDRSVNTANQGALNKDLLHNTRDLVVIEDDCGTPDGIELEISSPSIMDRYLAKDYHGVGRRNTLIDHEVILKAEKNNLITLLVRSPLTCESNGGVCIKCYGLMANGQPPHLGENVGVIDSQALTERITQLSMQAFHTGGAAGSATGKVIKSFPRLKELLTVPETVVGKAILAEESGTVRSIIPNPVGGFDLFIEQKRYYVPRDRTLKVQVGDMVVSGQALTDGSIKPQELSKFKDHLTAQQYVADEINHVYDDKFHRKTFETVVRGTSNFAEITDLPEDVDETNWLRGDLVPLTTLKKINRERAQNNKELIQYQPVFKSIAILPTYATDWLGKLTTSRLKDAILDAASFAQTTNLKGTDPMPAYLHAIDFGQKSEPAKKIFY